MKSKFINGLFIKFRIIKINKGFLKDQRILIYGKIKYENEKLMIIPKYFIGSGMVEFEESAENSMHQINHKLFNMLIFLVILSFVHFSIKTFFKKDEKKIKK